MRTIALRRRANEVDPATLLVVQPDGQGWRDSVDCGANSIEPHNPARNRSVTEFIAQLTAIDGAVVVTYDLTVQAFGAKIKELNERPTKVIERFIHKDRRAAEKDVFAFGFGMRHLSALQFVSQNPTAIALVVSQDGGLSIFERRSEDDLVSVTRHAEFVQL